ncbi:DMP19 family protein [Flavobacterium sp. RSSB_23]|uniref:DMP19 family protein n=1 Tax=Flavobacterium sp. RSSB_23 TaxID=3447668 RepID=UPI003F4102C8
MKYLIIRSIVLISFLNFFVCKAQNEDDPYWKFDKDKHFRPQLEKGDFFKLKGYDFGWFVVEPISKFLKDKKQEVQLVQSLSFGQKALYYWFNFDSLVANGGFSLFYENDNSKYVPTIIKGLEYVGATEAASLVKKSFIIYNKNKKQEAKKQDVDLLDSDFNDDFYEMSLLDEEYMRINEKTMTIIEDYIRKNSNEICLDENGNEFYMNSKGLQKTFYPNKNIKAEFSLEQGLINGKFKSFYENGNPKEIVEYKNGRQTGERKEYFENGKFKYDVSIDEKKDLAIHKWYYENGKAKKLETKLLNKDERFGEYKEWHENGKLAVIGSYKSGRDGQWLEFYKNGGPKIKATYAGGDFKLINCWNEKGEQTLTNGTGLYVYEILTFDNKVQRHEEEYKNYKRHGKQKIYTDRILTFYQEMENGKHNGITRRYYLNGNLRDETIYENDKEISSFKRSKFQNPKVSTVIVSKLCSECYKNYEDYVLPDNTPSPVNHLIIAEKFKAETSIFEHYNDDYILTYGYFLHVDEKGAIVEINFAVADNGWLDEQVKASMSELLFEPALKNGKPVKSIHYVQYKLKLTE